MTKFDEVFKKVSTLMEERVSLRRQKCVECGYEGNELDGFSGRYDLYGDPLCDDCALEIHPIRCNNCGYSVPESEAELDEEGLPLNYCKECYRNNFEDSETVEECIEAVGCGAECTGDCENNAGMNTADVLGPKDPNKSYAATTGDARVPEVLFTQSRFGGSRRKRKEK